jgi:hypothetical protein
MTFMQKQVERFAAWDVETTIGTELIPADLVGLNVNVDSFALYLQGEMRVDADGEFEATRVEGWFCRLSAPGYMDCTEWSGPYETEQEANEAFDQMWGDQVE